MLDSFIMLFHSCFLIIFWWSLLTHFTNGKTMIQKSCEILQCFTDSDSWTFYMTWYVEHFENFIRLGDFQKQYSFGHTKPEKSEPCQQPVWVRSCSFSKKRPTDLFFWTLSFSCLWNLGGFKCWFCKDSSEWHCSGAGVLLLLHGHSCAGCCSRETQPSVIRDTQLCRRKPFLSD